MGLSVRVGCFAACPLFQPRDSTWRPQDFPGASVTRGGDTAVTTELETLFWWEVHANRDPRSLATPAALPACGSFAVI